VTTLLAPNFVVFLEHLIYWMKNCSIKI